MWESIQKCKIFNAFKTQTPDNELSKKSFSGVNGLNYAFKNTINEEKLIGTWIVNEIKTLDLKNKGIEKFLEGFYNSVFIFKPNYNFQFISSNNLKVISMMLGMSKETQWRLNSEINEIEIGANENNFSTMAIEIQTHESNVVFYIKEAELSLIMEKR
jgi:hypothetical protein